MSDLVDDRKIEIINDVFGVTKEKISKSETDEFCFRYNGQDIKVPVTSIKVKETGSEANMFYYKDSEEKPTYVSCYNFLDSNKLIVESNLSKVDSSLISIDTSIYIPKKEDQTDFSYNFIDYKEITMKIGSSQYKIVPIDAEKTDYKIIKDNDTAITKDDLLKIKETIELNFFKNISENYKNKDAFFIYLKSLRQINELDHIEDVGYALLDIFDPKFTEVPFKIENNNGQKKLEKISKNKQKEIIKQIVEFDGGEALKNDIFDPISGINTNTKISICPLRLNITIPDYIKMYTEEDNSEYNFNGYEIDSIKHAVNVIVDENGKKYLVDSSLADYIFLFRSDNNSSKNFDIDLFNTQKLVPYRDLTKIYSVQEGDYCQLWSVFLNVETNKAVRDNPDKDPIEVINNNFDEIFLKASVGMSELIDKRKAVLFQKPVGSDENLYKPCKFNDKTIYVLNTKNSDLQSKCVRTDVLVNMIHKHEVERLAEKFNNMNEQIINNQEVNHEEFFSIHSQITDLLDTMKKDDLDAYVESAKERNPELSSPDILRRKSSFLKKHINELRKDQSNLKSKLVKSRPKFVPSGRKPEERSIQENKKASDSLNCVRKEIKNNQKQIVHNKEVSNYWQQRISEKKNHVKTHINPWGR